MNEQEEVNQPSTQIAFVKKLRYQAPNSVKFSLFPNCQEECQIEQIFCISQSGLGKALEIMFYFLTGGIGFIIFFWVPVWRFKAFFKICDIASSIGVTVFGPDGDMQIIQYLKSKSITNDSKVFEYRFQRYIFQDGQFVPFFENPFEMKNSEINTFSVNNQVDSTRITTSVLKNGNNCTDVPDRGLLISCMIEFFTPFYFFQIGSCILWFYEQYIYYSYVILCTAFIGFVLKIYEERTNFLRLKKFSYQRYLVNVQRGSEQQQVMNSEVIFGDILNMKKGEIVCCDMLVIQGSAVVNESMLTGESIPIVKTPLPNNDEKFTENKQSIIYSGSIILQTSNLKCQAFRLGFETLRGNLIRSIMYPKKHSQISFSTDAMYFIFIMGLAAIISFFVALPTFLQKLDDQMIGQIDVIIRCCDLITISVPPALPTCLSFGISFSMRRLAKKYIYCINSQKINVCGIVRTICFDKTGTLTESLLSYKLVSGFQQDNFQDTVNATSLNKLQRVILGACHSLQLFNGSTAGDPLDQEMFNSSGWVISEKTEEQLVAEGNGVKKEILSANQQERIEILETHQFESEYERMSTVVRFEGEYYLLCKGAPERLRTICTPESIPSGSEANSYTGKLGSFTKQGYRVISLCYKKIDAGSINKNRVELEQGLTYAGFLVFENKLKPETIPNIKILQDSKVQIHMVTGDNPQTSLNIAKQCNILNPEITVPILDYQNHMITIEIDGSVNEVENIDSIIADTSSEYVITGNFFTKFCIDDNQEATIKRLHYLLYMVKVYARMKPGQKQSLIRLMQKYSNKRGYTFIGMCGDGANDCQALKDADMGISLGDTEASIAASFTSKILNISVIEYTLREGRCCLTTSFQCFKFMALYSMIQVSTTAIEYHRGVIPADFQFLYWDLFIILPLAFLLGLTEASDKLQVEQPSHRLFSPSNIVSVSGLGIIQLIFLIITIVITASQHWYIDPITFQKLSGLDPSVLLMNSFDNTVLFWASNFQYLFCLVGFSVGSVQKKPFWTNIYFTAYLSLILIFSLYLLFTTNADVNNFFQLMPDLTNVNDNSVISSMTYGWRFAVLGIIIANTIITIFYEKYVCKWIVRAIENRFPSLTYTGISSVVVQRNSKAEDHSLRIGYDNPEAERINSY